MRGADEPILVRRDTVKRAAPAGVITKPGLHSRNAKRSVVESDTSRLSLLRVVRILLAAVGIAGVGYYAYTICDQRIYQVYENWAFDQQIGGRARVTFADYVREQTPFGFLAGASTATDAEPRAALSTAPRHSVTRPSVGSLLGRVSIARLNVSAIVREGVDAATLKNAVGHVPYTALPGETGNFAIAAHRDTLFRALKDIRQGDAVSFQSADGTYTYQVEATRIVKPSDVSVLRPDGGGLIARDTGSSSVGSTPYKLLTMITCYPFYYVGSAPKRFIVEARLVPETGREVRSETTVVQVPVPEHSTASAADPPDRSDAANASIPPSGDSRSHARPPQSAEPSSDPHAARFSGWQKSTHSVKKRLFTHGKST